jgi:hypothetical protein
MNCWISSLPGFSRISRNACRREYRSSLWIMSGYPILSCKDTDVAKTRRSRCEPVTKQDFGHEVAGLGDNWAGDGRMSDGRAGLRGI